jgi:ubiquinone biosynthesis protein
VAGVSSTHPATRVLVQHRGRAEEILGVFARHGIALMADGSVRARLADFLPREEARNGAPMSDGERLRSALSELGPTFIKLGQVLSTRIDLVGPDVAAELKALQTRCPEDSEDSVRATVEGDLGRPVTEAFSRFDFEPVASASVAQAHEAVLHDGTEVVVKVQHEGIHEVVSADFDILEALAAVLEEHDESISLWRPRAVVKQLRRTVLAELDLIREANFLQRAAANFRGEEDVVIPVPYTEVSGPRVLTMSRLQGRPLTSIADDPSVDRDAFALRAARIFLEMIFRDRLFHADPHPGNVLVEKRPEGLRYGILDWGEVGTIDRALEDKLGAFLMAAVSGDRADVADALLDVVTAPAHLDAEAFRLDVADWLDTHGSSGLQNLDVAGAVEDLTRIVREHRLRMPPDLAMLGKTLIQLQGDLTMAGAGLHIGEAVSGYMREIMQQRLSPERMAGRARRTAHDWERLAQQAPRELSAILEAIRLGELDVPLRLDTLDRNVNRLVYGILTAALFSGASNLWARRTPPLTKGGVSIPGAVGTIGSAAFALRILRAARRSGGLN